MSISIIATEIDLKTYAHVRYIQFDLDDGKGMCYRSRVSYNAFRTNAKRRYYNGDVMYFCEHDTSPVLRAEMQLIPAPVVQLANLWEFYKLIGYNYKTKKYTI